MANRPSSGGHRQAPDVEHQARPLGRRRIELLLEAAELIDRQSSHLAPGSPLAETPEGDLVRDLAEDIAEFAGQPVIYRITDRDFASRSLPVPVRLKELAKNWRLFWLYLPIALFPSHGWGFNRLEVLVEFNREEKDPGLRPKAFEILPHKKFQKLLGAEAGLTLQLKPNLEFGVSTGELEAQLGTAGVQGAAAVDAKAAAALGLVAGPFNYTIKKAKINHTAIGLEKVRWRLDGAEFFQEDAPTLIVILQVPKKATELRVAGVMEAYRYFDYASASLQEKIEGLPDRLAGFFKRGVPLRAPASWDLTKSIEA